MNDLRMGFKHAILQRMQCFGAATPEQSPGQIAAGSASKQTRSSTVMHQSQVTDFSINRILGATNAPAPAVASQKSSTSMKAPTVTSRFSTSADILDLSKGSANSSAAAFQPCSTTYASFHQDFLAAAAAANATKFYAHFFPNMFPAYHQVLATHPAVHTKRYFAPYVLNSSTPSTNPSSSSHLAASAVSPGLSSSPGSNEAPRLRRNEACPRNCTDCIVYYQQTPDKSAALSRSVLASGSAPGSSYLKTKSSAEIMFNSSSASSTFANPPPTASLISLTAVTNLNFTAKVSKSDVLKDSTSALNLEEISYKCRICDKVFGCSQTLQAHERTHKSPRYECTDCGKGFSQLRNYKYHLSVHRGTKEFAAECPECGKTFNDKGYLSSHMKIHRNKKEYECPYCPKSFNQRVAFNMHVRIHTGVKPHKCAECGKRFSRKMLLKQHMRTHSGEKPYQCSVCGKSFADRSNMTLHHRLHSGIKPFNCPICPKAFTKKHHLKTHLNYHTGCKPYVCPHPNCNQAFSQSSNMRTHAKKCQYRPLAAMPFPAISPVMSSSVNVKTSATAASSSSASIRTNTSVATTTNNTSLLPFAGNVALRLPPPATTSSGFTAGIRMLSFGVPATLPPAQQHLVASLRPF